MNRRESAIISAYTGILVGPFDAMHAYAEEKLQRPVWTHDLGSEEVSEQLKAAARDDLIALAEATSGLPQEPWESAPKYSTDAAAHAQRQMIDNIPADMLSKTVVLPIND